MSDTTSRRPDPELFIGLVGAVGTDNDLLTTILQDELRAVDYLPELVRLTRILRQEIPKYSSIATSPFDDYIRDHQKAGDGLRRTTQQGDALAVLGFGAITKHRRESAAQEIESGNWIPDEWEKKNDDEKERELQSRIASRTAYIFRTLKNPVELDTLQGVYSPAFVLVAAYSPYSSRRRHLAAKIAETRHDFTIENWLSKADELIQYDQGESTDKLGQNVRRTFHRADVFVDASDPDSLRNSVRRFIELWFGNSFITPTRDEFGMFHAQAAALRSAELGRQVGAAITTPEGDVIAVGTNEVPKAGGGLYWAGDRPDQREFVLGEDSNDKHKRNLLADLLSRLQGEGWLSPVKSGAKIDDLVQEALDNEKSPKIASAHLTNLIEFGRAVHAEMAALMDAARRGVSVSGATMFVTTFPCHLCARHIVAAGIKRVVYIEPYAKSLAAQLYPDSISVDGYDTSEHQIRFEPFVGIAPRKYMEFFSIHEDRKTKGGKIKPFIKSGALPIMSSSPRFYLQNELIKKSKLELVLKEKGLL